MEGCGSLGWQHAVYVYREYPEVTCGRRNKRVKQCVLRQTFFRFKKRKKVLFVGLDSC